MTTLYPVSDNHQRRARPALAARACALALLAATLLTAGLLSPLRAGAQTAAPESPRKTLERGFYLEQGLKKLDEAITVYEEVLGIGESAPREVLAEALFRIGVCERARGREVEAAKRFQAVVDSYGDVAAIRGLAEAELRAGAQVRRSLRLYDIEFLTRAVETSSPSVELGRIATSAVNNGAPLIFADEEVGEGIGLDPNEIADLLRQNIAEDTWQNARNAIEVQKRSLAIVQTADVHRQITAYLEYLRSRRGRLVTFEVRLALVEASLLSSLGSGVLSGTERGALDARLTTSDGALLIATQTVTAFHRQEVHAGVQRERRFVTGYTVDQTGVLPTLRPTVETIVEGVAFDLTPTLVGQADAMILEVAARHVSLVDGDAIETETIEGAGSLQRVVLDSFRVATTLLARSGDTVLLGGARAPQTRATGLEAPCVIALVRPRLSALGAGSDRTPPAVEGRSLRVYNVSLLSGWFDTPLRSGLLEVFEPGAAPDEGEDEDDPPLPFIEPDSLAGMIEQGVSPDSWGHELNTIEALVDGQLAVTQTPTVHAQISAFLASLRRERGRALAVEVRLVETDGTALDTVLRDATALDEGRFLVPVKRYEELVRGTDTVGWAALTVLNGHTGQASFVTDKNLTLDVGRVAGGTGTQVATLDDPHNAVVPWGIDSVVRATLIPGATHVQVDARFEVAMLHAVPSLKIREWTLHLPELSRSKHQTQLTFPVDRVLLVSAQRTPKGSKALFLRVRPIDLLK